MEADTEQVGGAQNSQHLCAAQYGGSGSQLPQSWLPLNSCYLGP